MKLSFKKQAKLTGLASIANPETATEIKANKKIVGTIAPPRSTDTEYQWRMMFMVEKSVTTEDPCKFKWVTLAKKTATEEEARKFITDNWDKLQSSLDLYQQED